MGIKGYQITEKTGKAAGVKAVDEIDDILLISDDGTMIRMSAADVNLYSRAAQGVKVMRLAEGSKVIALARVEKVEEETGPSDGEAEDEETAGGDPLDRTGESENGTEETGGNEDEGGDEA